MCERVLFLVLFAAVALFPAHPSAQQPAERANQQISAGSQEQPAAPDGDAGDGHKRILGIIPNYRSSPPLTNYAPLTAEDKFKVAGQDAFDPGTFVLAGLFAAEAQLTGATPSFGHGVPAYARYFVASTADFMIGDFMTEAVYPALLRQDPRYFRKGTGNTLARLGYAVRQMVWTHADSGHMQVNVSEIAGNATAVAIGNAYYPDNRTLSSNISKLGIQLAVDTVSNILKEFSPDLDRLLSRSHTARPRS
jgi:hypothetical protein